VLLSALDQSGTLLQFAHVRQQRRCDFIVGRTIGSSKAPLRLLVEFLDVALLHIGKYSVVRCSGLFVLTYDCDPITARDHRLDHEPSTLPLTAVVVPAFLTLKVAARV
jgi:hypothetical protein